MDEPGGSGQVYAATVAAASEFTQGNLMRWMAIKHPGQRSAVYCDAHDDWIQRVAHTWSD